jgi:hypothetical protein
VFDPEHLLLNNLADEKFPGIKWGLAEIKINLEIGREGSECTALPL